MDWARAIERNSEALIGIVAALFAMLGLEGGGMVERIPRQLHRAVLRVLRPAESAVRRLIVIAARGVVAKPAPARPMPEGGIKTKGGARRPAFPLFDPRKRFAPWRPKPIPDNQRPRVWVLGDTPPGVVIFRPEDFGKPVPAPDDGRIDATRLGRRLDALKLALADLPRQARRLARWRAKRENAPSLGSRAPMRPGRPPGYRKKPTHDVDEVLTECHALAWDALGPDTS
jgi:hypothetical protein